MDMLLDKLNEDQIKPVKDTEGAVLVLAGAGSGKTRVLTSRIAYILREGKAKLSQILAITFTNKAANEMKERLAVILGDGQESKWICTIHSMCVKILREFGSHADIKSNFSIYSDVERNNVLKKLIKEAGVTDESFSKSVKYHIGNSKMLGLDPDEYCEQFDYEDNIELITEIHKKYNDHLRKNNALDFDDLLIETLRLLRKDEEVRSYLSDKFKYILVDEFQDTNAVQYSIIKLLSSVHGNIFVVGDDDQSIYGWRGAEINNILHFDKDFAGAKVYKLERNYRSTKSILALANAIIKNNSSRRGKVLWTDGDEGARPEYFQAEEESEEAMFAAKRIAAAVRAGGRYSDFAVLMRINALTRSYEQKFTEYGIPYKVFGGFRFYERKEIKDALAYLRLINNPFDSEAAERIINVPRRGIGGKTIEVMYAYAEQNGLSLFDAALDADKLALPRSVKDKLKDFAELIVSFVKDSVADSVAQLIRNVINRADLRSAYDDGTDEGDGKLANLDEFIASVDDFARLNPEATLDEFLNQVTLSSDIDDADDGNYVTLATIHAVKGLEFDGVFICGLEDGIIPSSRSETDPRDIEEERRLMYVAITRARKSLYLTRSKSRYLYGHREMTRPSRFVTELAPALGIDIKTFNRSTYGGGYDRYKDRYVRPSVHSAADDDRPVSSAPPSVSPKSDFKPGWGGPVKRAPEAGGAKYAVGMKVMHPKFGAGMVIAVKNNGNTINVAFDGQGIKELSASLAPLKIIPR